MLTQTCSHCRPQHPRSALWPSAGRAARAGHDAAVVGGGRGRGGGAEAGGAGGGGRAGAPRRAAAAAGAPAAPRLHLRRPLRGHHASPGESG